MPKTVIRARFDDTARGTKGTSDLFSLPEGSLAVGFVRPPDVAFAQARKLESVDYDLHQAKWIAGVEEESFVMVARRGLPVEPQALRAAGNSLIMPVSDILATHATVGVLLNAVTGIGAKVVVGTGNSARLKSILAGDADFYTAAADEELQPLFKLGDVQALYTIVGEQFPPQVDRSRTLESFLVPGAPQAVVDYIKSARGMGRAFFAPPGVKAEDVAALREAFTRFWSTLISWRRQQAWPCRSPPSIGKSSNARPWKSSRPTAPDLSRSNMPMPVAWRCRKAAAIAVTSEPLAAAQNPSPGGAP